MYRVYLLYALSGFLSLGYQVAWFRICIDWFGSTNLTFALVVANFIGGLGLGALVSKSVSNGLATALGVRDRLRLYGLVELLVTAAVSLTLLAQLVPAGAWGSFPYHLAGGVYKPDFGYQMAQLAIAVGCVFIPCFFMGVTFPLLCDVYRGVAGNERFPSALYGWNTLGACIGVLACLFVLLPWAGHERMFWLLAGGNLLLGLYFLLTGGAPRAASDIEQPHAAQPRPLDSSAVALLVTCAVLSGLLAGALEGDLFKRIDFMSAGTSSVMALIAFWAILAIFLASWTVHAAPAMTLRWIKAAYVTAFIVYLSTWIGEGGIRKGVWVLEGRPATGIAGFDVAFISSPVVAVVFVGVFVFPAFFCISLLLPYVCNRLHASRRHLGLAYGLNTLAFCAGIIGLTHVAPRVDIFYSLKLMMVLLGIGAALLAVLSESRRFRPWIPVAGTIAVAAACLLTPRGFDPGYMMPGGMATGAPVRALKSNGAHTTFVVEGLSGDFLFFERHPMSSTDAFQARYMRLMAHFPLLAHPDPKRALLIGYGVGNTASAIATHDSIEAIDVVDLNEIVIETAPEFAEATNAVHADPRVRYIIDDGRNFLGLTDLRYDLITSEPPPPMQAGVYRLYTSDYYADVLAHLTPRGMMTQWVPSYQMPPEAVELAVRTFIEVFPHAILFTGGHREFIIVGSPSPIDLRCLEKRFHEWPAVAADLRGLGVKSPLSLLARIVQGDGELRRRFGGGRVIRDVHNDLEFLFQQSGALPVITFDPVQVLTDIEPDRLDCGQRLRSVLTHLGRLRYHVGNYPMPTLLTTRTVASGPVQLAEVDWEAAQQLSNSSVELRATGRSNEAYRMLLRSLEIADEQPDVLIRLALLEMTAGNYVAAGRTMSRFLRIEPYEEVGHRMLGQALFRQGLREEALTSLRRAVEADTYSPDAHYVLGNILARSGDPDQGVRHLLQALALQPDRKDIERSLQVAREMRPAREAD